MTNRRTFVRTLGGGLVAASLAVHAQPAKKVYRIGFLEAGAASVNEHFLRAFESGLREFGYVEGTNLVIDARWAEGRADRFPELLAELAARDPDVIVVASTLGAVAARKTVASIPVVFVGAADPIEKGLVASLARPGGNMTGLSRVFGDGLIGKALQLFKEIVPAASRIAVLWNAAGEVEPRLKEAQTAVRALGMTPLPIEVRGPSDLDGAFTRMRRQNADAVMVVTDPLTLRYRETIVKLAAAYRIPAVYEFAEFARAGGLVAYSASVPALFARAAVYVDKILKGAKPAELSVEQPTKFELVINMKTARALGLTVPQSLLLRADEVIQ
ncbi:MAG: ABC transporter substrate-binding protein [Casimicrobiaceae bacterium]